MRRTNVLVVLSILCPLFALCPSAVHAQQVDTIALTGEIPHLLEAGGVPGLSIAVIVDGRVYWKGAFGTGLMRNK